MTTKHRPKQIPVADEILVLSTIGLRHGRGQGIGHGVRADPAGGTAVSRSGDVHATTGAVAELAGQLRELGIEEVTVESTPD